MSHVLILMNTCADELRGDATTGKIVELKTAFNAVDTWLKENPDAPEAVPAHETMERVEAWLCSGGEFEMGAVDQVSSFTQELNDYL